MFKIADICSGDTFSIGRPFLHVLKTFQNQKKWFYFFSGINTFLTKIVSRLPNCLPNHKNPYKMSKIAYIFGGDFKKYKKISPPKHPPNIISGRLFNNSFSFSKNMKIISENSENQLFFIPLICLQSLLNDFQKSNFIFFWRSKWKIWKSNISN